MNYHLLRDGNTKDFIAPRSPQRVGY